MNYIIIKILSMIEWMKNFIWTTVLNRGNLFNTDKMKKFFNIIRNEQSSTGFRTLTHLRVNSNL